MRVIVTILLFCYALLSFGQCPTFNYTLGTDFCRDEQLDISDVTSGSSYEWDFCAGEIASGFTASNILTNSAFNRDRTIKIVEDNGDYYAFTISQTSNNLQRINLGADLSSISAQYNNLGTFSGSFSGAYDLDIIHDGSIWRGFVANTSGGTLIRLDFTSGITSSPDIVSLGNLGGDLTSPTHILLVEENGNYFGFVSDGTDLIRLSFGSDLTETSPSVDAFTVSGSNTLRGMDLTKDCDVWVGLILSYSSNDVLSVDFDNSLTNTPSFVELTTTNTIRFPANVEIINDAANYYAFVQGALGDFYEFDLGSNVSDFTFSDSEITDGVFTSDENFALEYIKQGTAWYGFNFNLGPDQLIQLSYPDNCNANIPTSTEQHPGGISYSQIGTYQIETRFESSTGEILYDVSSVNVSTDIAPAISFSIDESRCTSVTNTFSPSTPGLTSYDWDFDGDGMIDVSDPTGADQMYNFMTPGTYPSRLYVNDGTCDNFYEQVITIYPDPPTPTFTAVSTECSNTDITFTNTTDETGFDDALSYTWDFNGEGSSTEDSPTFAFATSGTKTVTATAEIPGCQQISVPFDIEILIGPTASYSASTFSICEGETISFTDQSTGSGLSFAWDFDEGGNLMDQNPMYTFNDSGSFNVSLTVTDDQGCSSTRIQEVVVGALPVADFDFNVACTGELGTQFSDVSSVEGSDIASRTWFVDGVEVSTDQNPFISFPNEGSADVQLTVVSSSGCETTYQETIDVLSAPTSDFIFTVGCLGEETSFQDTSVPANDPIVSWLWTIDGQNFSTRDVNYAFSTPGSYDVSLEVTGQNFCAESITQTIEILALPTPGFSVTGDCSNELINVSDLSEEFQDPIVTRNWFLDGTQVGNGDNLVLEDLADNTYELTLELITNSGCTVTTSQALVINEAPISEMSVSSSYGLPGDQIIFTNLSSGASNIQWLLNDELYSTSDEDQTVIFSEPGSHIFSLVASNSLGCTDTTSQEILIAIPEVDLVASSFELVDVNGTGTLFLEITNNSNLPVEVTEVIVELENQFSVSEQILQFIDVGQSVLVNLTVGVPLSVSQVSYLCATVNSQYVDYPDLTPVDNEACLTLEPRVIVESSYPNPATDQIRVKVVSDAEGIAKVTLINAAGKVEFISSEEVQAGLNNFFIDLQTLRRGIYFIRIELAGTISDQRIIKL